MIAPLNLLRLLGTLAASELPSLIKRVTETPGVIALTVPPVHVAATARLLASLNAKLTLCTVVSYPAGTSKATIKAIEASSALKDGVAEVIVAPHYPPLLAGDVEAVKTELREIARAARATRRDVQLRLSIRNAGIQSHPDRYDWFAAAARCALESGFDSLQLFKSTPDRIGPLTSILPIEAHVFGPNDPAISALAAVGVSRFAVISLDPVSQDADDDD